MLEKNEFEKWIEASHTMFEIFEGRYDAYPLAVRWIDEWFLSSQCISSCLVENLKIFQV